MSQSAPGQGDATQVESAGNIDVSGDYPWRNEDLLKALYWERELSLSQVAERLNTSVSTVVDWMERHSIERRSRGNQIQHPRLQDENLLREWYFDEELSMRDIATRVGCDNKTVSYWFDKHGIDVPSIGHRDQTGENNPYWSPDSASGINYGEGWPQQRKKALKRDNYTCRACGMTRDEHRSEYGLDISVHHIVPVRDFEKPEEAHSLENLVTACASCHKRYEGLPVFPHN